MKKLAFLYFFLMVLSLKSQYLPKDPEIVNYVSKVSSDSLKNYINQLVSFGTRHTMSSVIDKNQGIGAARNWVLSKFKTYAKNSNGRMEVFLQNQDLQPDGKRIDKVTNLGNAVAILHGTNKKDNRVFIISGHLDSRVSNVMNATDIAPGANDDGSGVAAVIEAARILSKSQFPATIIFVAFSGEEQGLLGAKLMTETSKKEQWNIAAVLNNDMIGNSNSSDTHINDNTKVRVFSYGLPPFTDEKSYNNIRALGLENDGLQRQLARYIKEVGERYVDLLEVKLVYRNDRFLRGGDHTPFANENLTAVRITEMNENYNHQHQDLRTENGIEYGDLPKFMDFEYLRKNTALNIAVLSNLAKAPNFPESAKMEVKELTNFTTLSWEKPKVGTVLGYQVLMRETDSSVWQKKFFTKETTLKLPYSKDNYFFAVQSLSEKGNESLPIIPNLSK